MANGAMVAGPAGTPISPVGPVPPPPTPPTFDIGTLMTQLEPTPNEKLAAGLGALAGLFEQGQQQFGGALQSGVMGGYGNRLAKMQLMMQLQQQNYQAQQQAYEQQQAYRQYLAQEQALQTFPEEERQMVRAIGLPAYYQARMKAGQPTTKMRDYQSLISLGYSPEEASKVFFGQPTVQVSMGATPRGHRPIFDESGELVEYELVKGAPEYRDLAEGVTAAKGAVEDVDLMIESLGQEGATQMLGEAWGTAGPRYGQILAGVAEAQNKGVLQQGELELIRTQLTDPTKAESIPITTRAAMAQYRELRRILLRRVQQAEAKLSGAGPEAGEAEAEQPAPEFTTTERGSKIRQLSR